MNEPHEELFLLANAVSTAGNNLWGKKTVGKSARKKNRAKNKAARIARRKNK